MVAAGGGDSRQPIRCCLHLSIGARVTLVEWAHFEEEYVKTMNSGGATGMATMAMAIELLGMLWPLMALAIALFTQRTVYTNF